MAGDGWTDDQVDGLLRQHRVDVCAPADFEISVLARLESVVEGDARLDELIAGHRSPAASEDFELGVLARVDAAVAATSPLSLLEGASADAGASPADLARPLGGAPLASRHGRSLRRAEPRRTADPRRRRLLPAAVAAVLLVSLSVSLWQWLEARSALQQATASLAATPMGPGNAAASTSTEETVSLRAALAAKDAELAKERIAHEGALAKLAAERQAAIALLRTERDSARAALEEGRAALARAQKAPRRSFGDTRVRIVRAPRTRTRRLAPLPRPPEPGAAQERFAALRPRVDAEGLRRDRELAELRATAQSSKAELAAALQALARVNEAARVATAQPMPADAAREGLLRAMEGAGDAPTPEAFARVAAFVTSGTIAHPATSAHRGRIEDLDVAPRASRLVTAGRDGTARVWDLAGGTLVASLEGHGGPVTSARMDATGLRVLTASADGSARLFGATDGRLRATFSPPVVARPEAAPGTASVPGTAVALVARLSPDGTRVLTAHGGYTRLFEATGALVATLTAHDDQVLDAAFSPDSRRIATVGRDGRARLHGAAGGALLGELEAHPAPIRTLAFDRSGAQLATGCDDGRVRVFHVEGGRLLHSVSAHRGPVTIVRFSHLGRRILSGGEDGKAQVIAARTGRATASLEGHTGGITDAAFSDDVRRVITASRDETLGLWRLDGPRPKRLGTLRGHAGAASRARFGAGTELVSAGEDGSLRLWPGRTDTTLARFDASASGGAADELWQGTFSADGRWFVTASAKGVVRWWDVAGGQLVRSRQALQGDAYAVELLRGGRVAVAGREQDAGRVRFFSPAGELLPLALSHEGEVRSLAASPDGTRLVTASGAHAATLWNVADGQRLSSLLGHDKEVEHVAFRGDGERFLTAGRDGRLILWSKDGVELRRWDGAPLRYAAFSSSGAAAGARAASGGSPVIAARADGSLQLHGEDTDAPLATVKGAHDSSAVYAVFVQGGTRVLSTGDDGTARLWDGRTLWPLQRYDLGARMRAPRAEMSADGAHVLVPAFDGGLRLFDAQSGRLVSTLGSFGSPLRWGGFAPDGKTAASVAQSGAAATHATSWPAILAQVCALVRRDPGYPRVAKRCEAAQAATP